MINYLGKLQILQADRDRDSGITRARILFVARDVPALGYATYRIIPQRSAAAASKEAVEDKQRTFIENESYRAGFDLANGGQKVVAGSAKFNAWSSSISFKQGTDPGGFATVAPGATDATVSVSVNSAESNLTPALGVMVVTSDNKSGADEAQLIRVK